MDTKGRIAVVTGAAGGIGGAIVRGLVAEGARAVVATDLDVSGVEQLASDLNGDTATAAGGARVFPRQLDVSDELATRALVDEIDGTVGPIDLWFANAGLSGGGGPEAADLVWERQWQVNVMAHVYAARALLPGWVARGEGHLVTTASMAGLLTSLGDGVYAATKHAAVGLAEWLAITYADQGVKVSCVCPGAVNTNMLRGGAGGDADKAAAAIGGGDVLDPSGAAAAILEGVRADRFLIYTHPDLKRYLVGKTDDPERWITGMARLWKRSQELLAE
jgi:NAD(P)-dependent dehydrogenase (short-subunit alcohol dehydrogenase family)